MRHLPLLLTAAISASTLTAIDIDGYSSATNDRFANNGSFIMDSFDLSGVGRSSDGRWATLVSNNVFISANHFHPGDAASVTFFQTNDPNGPSITIGVADGQGMRVGDSDIWMGVLDSPVPAGYTSYAYPAEVTPAQVIGQNGYFFGNSSSSPFTGLERASVGRNVIDVYTQISAQGTTGDGLVAVDQGPNLAGYEALLEPGDSGGPMFIDDPLGGGLQLVGANWFVLAAGDTGNPSLSFDASGTTYLGAYSADIQGFVADNFIPEPSTYALAVGALMGVIALRRRR